MLYGVMREVTTPRQAIRGAQQPKHKTPNQKRRRRRRKQEKNDKRKRREEDWKGKVVKKKQGNENWSTRERW
jgi:hypothetical protein